jgi:prepilin peptidase CpaA
LFKRLQRKAPALSVPRPDAAHLAVAAALTALLLWAAASDVSARRIPNASVLAVLALYPVWAVLGPGAEVISALEAAAIGFAVGFGLYYFNVMGAGDVKLFAAAALFIGLGHLAVYALATVLSGGAIALASLAARPRRAAVMFALRGKGDFGRGIPYGVAIAFGAALVVWGALFDTLPSNILTGG